MNSMISTVTAISQLFHLHHQLPFLCIDRQELIETLDAVDCSSLPLTVIIIARPSSFAINSEGPQVVLQHSAS